MLNDAENDEIKELRKLYIEATLDQRMHVIDQILEKTPDGPMELVVALSAVEGVARAVLIELEMENGKSSEAAYQSFLKSNANDLIGKLKTKWPMEEIASTEEVHKLNSAVLARNLICHECTYLRETKYSEYSNLCRKVYNSLKALARAKNLTLIK